MRCVITPTSTVLHPGLSLPLEITCLGLRVCHEPVGKMKKPETARRGDFPQVTRTGTGNFPWVTCTWDPSHFWVVSRQVLLFRQELCCLQ